MDLRKLSIFVCVAESGSFTRAAGHLAVAQSALSRQIRELENEIGIPLLYRNGRGVVLTEVGETLLPRAKTILGDADALLAELRALRGVVSGTVKLGVPPSVSSVLLSPLLATLGREYPDVQMHVVEGFSGHIHEWLLSGRIDLAVLYSRSSPLLSSDPLLREDVHLIGLPDDSVLDGVVEFAHVAKLPLVLPGRPHGLRLILDEACVEAHVTLNVRLQVEALETIKRLVFDQGMYTILPLAAVVDELKKGTLASAAISNPTVTRELLLTRSSMRPENPATRAVARILRAEVKELVSRGVWPLARL